MVGSMRFPAKTHWEHGPRRHKHTRQLEYAIDYVGHELFFTIVFDKEVEVFKGEDPYSASPRPKSYFLDLAQFTYHVFLNSEKQTTISAQYFPNDSNQIAPFVVFDLIADY